MIDVYIENQNDILHETSVDFVLRPCSKEIHIVQYDKSLPVVKVELYSNGERYSFSENAVVNVRATKLDGKFVYKHVLGSNVERNTVYFEVDGQMAMVPGRIPAVIEIIEPATDVTVACSSPIQLIIDKNPIKNRQIESEDYFPIIYELQVKLAVEPNPTVPSGVVPTALTTLKIGDDYFAITGGGGSAYGAGNGLILSNSLFSIDTTIVATKTDLEGKQDSLPSGAKDRYLHTNASTGEYEWVSISLPSYTAGTGLTLSGSEFSVDTTTIATKTDLAGKQDSLPSGAKDRYLHTNTSTGAIEWVSIAVGGVYTAGTGLSLNNNEFSIDTTVVATKQDLTSKQDALPSIINNRYLHTNTETGAIEWVSLIIPSYTAGNGISISNGEIAIDGTVVATKSDLNGKQDALPSVINDRYLHTNATTGALEWVTVSGGGGGSYSAGNGLLLSSGNVFSIDTAVVATKSDLNGKQDVLPTVVADRYLHTNSSTGAIEWVSIPEGLSNPMTAADDLIIGGAVVSGSATPVRLAKGNNGELLRINGSGSLGYGKNLPYIDCTGVSPVYPSEANTDGLIIVLCRTEPSTKLSGYLYIVLSSQAS